MRENNSAKSKEMLLGDIIETRSLRGVISRSEKSTDGIAKKYINIKNIESGRIRPDCEEIIFSQTELEKATPLKAGDIIVSAKGIVYKAAIVSSENEGCILSSNVIGFRLKTKEVLPEYIVTYLNCPEGQKQLVNQARGVGLPSINFAALKNVTIPVISLESQQLLSKYLSLVRSYYDHLDIERKIMEEIEEYVIYTSMRD